MNPFVKIWDELSVVDDILLRTHRIIIPITLRRKIVKVAHEGHLGIVKTKNLLRSRVWFPKLDSLVEEEVKNCIPCLAAVNQNITEPLKMTPLPNGPWENLKCDFFGPIPSGVYIFVIVDEYSRFPIVETVTSTSSNLVIPILDETFSIFGVPNVLTSGNGPPFNGEEIGKFAEYLGFKHRKITPAWPKANSLPENFNSCLKKVLQTSRIQRLNWQQELNKFLRNYRAAPHATTGRSPAELLFARKQFKTRLPELPKPYDDDGVRKRDKFAKSRMKHYADNKMTVRETQFNIGDRVLVKQKKKG